MSFGLESPDLPPAASRWPRFTCPWRPPEPLTAGELRNGLWAGDNAPNDVEHLLVLTSRAAGALEVAMGEGLAALRVGDRLVSLGFSNLGDFAREVLGIGERKALAMAHLAEGLRSRPLLRAAVCAGEVRIRSAEVVLPVAAARQRAAGSSSRRQRRSGRSKIGSGANTRGSARRTTPGRCCGSASPKTNGPRWISRCRSPSSSTRP